MFISKLAGAMGCGFQRIRSTIFSYNLPKFTKWREENIKKAVKHATFLDFEVVDWLRETSPNRSVHRIIARCAAVHPIISEQFHCVVENDLFRTLEISETNAVDIRHGLCFGLTTYQYDHWELLRSISDVVESQLEEGEYQSYLCIAETALQYNPKRQTLLDAMNGDFSLPLAIWCYLLKNTSIDDTVAVHILTHGTGGLFNWKFNPTRELIRNAGLVRFDSKELGWWNFDYLFHYFKLGEPDYSSEAKTDTTYCLLLVAIYRNLTSDDPLIADKEERQGSLEHVFHSFFDHSSFIVRGNPRTLEDALRFFTEICCVDSFRCESMTDHARWDAVYALWNMVRSISHLENRLHATNFHNLSLIYRWYSGDFDPKLSYYTPLLFMLLLVLVPQNRHHLFTILLNDPDAVSHFSKCFHNLANHHYLDREATRIFPILMDLFESVGPKKNTLFTIFYSPSVLVQLWKALVWCRQETKWYFLLVKSKIDREKLDELFAAMNELARSDDLKNLPYECRRNEEVRDKVRSALAASAREFGQLIGVSHTQLEATADKSAPENSASEKDHDTEERAQVSEHKNYHSVANWMKKVFESIWSKTPRQIDQELRVAD